MINVNTNNEHDCNFCSHANVCAYKDAMKHKKAEAMEISDNDSPLSCVIICKEFISATNTVVERHPSNANTIDNTSTIALYTRSSNECF